MHDDGIRIHRQAACTRATVGKRDGEGFICAETAGVVRAEAGTHRACRVQRRARGGKRAGRGERHCKQHGKNKEETDRFQQPGNVTRHQSPAVKLLK
ncbi:hypothetical protein BN128_3927 [Cronobacter sakazakii 696]|nr:hypothetical protein BN128_3927 [Cronobacter sakazakii 696]